MVKCRKFLLCGILLQYRLKKVAIQKLLKDKDDEWKSTHRLDQKDIPKMMLALSKAYEYLTLSDDK
jgi:hypothetical protein